MANSFTLESCYIYAHQQPCWDCKNACGGCSWSAKFEPVDGWKAREVIRPTYNTVAGVYQSYAIDFCPEYDPEPPRHETCW